MTATPVDPDHAAMWESINAQGAAISRLNEEISVNGYGEILREIARRYKARREVWDYFRRPRQLLAKGFWIALGGAAAVVVGHFIH